MTIHGAVTPTPWVPLFGMTPEEMTAAGFDPAPFEELGFLDPPASADTTPPPTTAAPAPAANAEGWHQGPVTVELAAHDGADGSGVKELHYALEGATEDARVLQAGRASVAITAEGATTLTYFAVDHAGHQEAPRTLTVRIDTTPPAGGSTTTTTLHGEPTTTTTTTLPGEPTTTMTTMLPGTVTTTTLPGDATCPPDDAGGLGCLCERDPGSTACAGDALPSKVTRTFAHACQMVTRGATAGAGRKGRRSLGRAAALFARTLRIAGRPRMARALSVSCQTALAATLGDAEARARRLEATAPAPAPGALPVRASGRSGSTPPR